MTARGALAALLIGTVSPAAAQDGGGYYPDGSVDLIKVLPPPPVRGDVRDRVDRAVFKATQRRFVGTARWNLAINDVKLAPADLMRDFSCSVGVVLTPANAPRTAAIIARLNVTSVPATQAAKVYFNRARPFQVDRPRRLCQDPSQLAGSPDYPSGHTTLGWTWAMILAALAPDRATQILARGRAYGESRLVCGVHNYSAVEAGRIAASALVATAGSSPAFRADLAAAREEIGALRRVEPAPEQALCALEAQLIEQPVLLASPRQ